MALNRLPISVFRPFLALRFGSPSRSLARRRLRDMEVLFLTLTLSDQKGTVCARSYMRTCGVAPGWAVCPRAFCQPLGTRDKSFDM